MYRAIDCIYLKILKRVKHLTKTKTIMYPYLSLYEYPKSVNIGGFQNTYIYTNIY